MRLKQTVAILALAAAAAASPAARQVRFDDVVRNLRNPDPRARLESIELLRDSKHLEAIEPIAPLVTDPVDEIQLAAIGAELSFFLVDDVNARRRVAFLVEVRNAGRAETAFASGPLAVWPRPVPAALTASLLRAVDDEQAKVRVEAIYTLGTIASPPLAETHVPDLIRALDHYDPAIRAAAARVAGRLKVTQAGPALIKAVNDSQPLVRYAAMRALGEIRETTAVQALTEQLVHYRKGEGAWSALDGLAHLAHPSSVPVFVERLTDRDAYMRRAAVEGLARTADAAQTETLERIATADPSDMVRAAAAFALQRRGADRLAALVAPLRDSRLAPQIAGYVLELGPSVAPGLAAHLAHADEAVRGNVALLVGAVGTAAQIPALEPLLLDRSADVRRAAERAIQRIKVRGA